MNKDKYHYGGRAGENSPYLAGKSKTMTPRRKIWITITKILNSWCLDNQTLTVYMRATSSK